MKKTVRSVLYGLLSIAITLTALATIGCEAPVAAVQNISPAKALVPTPTPTPNGTVLSAPVLTGDSNPWMYGARLTWPPVPGATSYDLSVSSSDPSEPLKIVTGVTSGVFSSGHVFASYVVAVRAVNSSGTSAWSNSFGYYISDWTPTPPPLQKPILNLEKERFMKIQLNWGVPYADHYHLMIESWPVFQNPPVPTVTYVMDPIRPYVQSSFSTMTNYRYSVMAINRFGSSAWSNPITVSWGDPVLLPTPTQLTATAVDSTTIQVNWISSAMATSFDITVDGVEIQDVTMPYIHANLVPGSTHTYAVRAISPQGFSLYTSIVSATTTPQYQAWTLNGVYNVGDIVTYQGTLYKCTIAHTAYAANWDPVDAPALWTKL